MADVMAIVSKAVFEKLAGKAPVIGAKLLMDRYVSANKALAHVAGGGKLFLVTVRPPNEALWLVAILDAPKFDGTQWISAPSQLPITDITALRSKLVFESGKGITADPGALGMSLQTPRVLAPADVALLTGVELVVVPAELGKQDTGDRPRKDALIQAIIDDPEGDLPRQVYADERLLHHDPRGELIVLDLALAKPLSIRKRAQLAARRKELLAEQGKAWFPYKLGGSRRRGGFLESVTGTLAQLTNEASAELFASQPIVEVMVTGVEGTAGVKKLLKAPWLSRMRRLVVRGALGDDGFAALVAAPAVQQLQALNVTANGIKSLAALAGNLPACRLLALTGNSIGDAGALQLAAWTHLPKVETLYLSKCGITSKGAQSLLAVAMPGLEKLCLSSNALKDKIGEVVIVNAKHVPNLRRLELKNASLSIDAVDAVMKAKLPRLASLDVRINNIHANAVSGYAPRVRSDRG